MPERLEQQARGLVNVRTAAGLLKIDQQNVYQAIWRRALRARKYNRKWQIPLSEINRYQNRKRDLK